tara:strand:+ start:199 stop:624 length:426 start_codon:yes stop_codon:yes gene_type:complete
MKKIYTLFIFLIILFSCNKDEENTTCLADGTWSLSHTYIASNPANCENSCSSSAEALQSGCTNVTSYDEGCVIISIEGNLFTVTTSNGVTSASNWAGNCEEGEVVSSVLWNNGSAATISSLSSNELILTELASERVWVFTK